MDGTQNFLIIFIFVLLCRPRVNDKSALLKPPLWAVFGAFSIVSAGVNKRRNPQQNLRVDGVKAYRDVETGVMNDTIQSHCNCMVKKKVNRKHFKNASVSVCKSENGDLKTLTLVFNRFTVD